MKSAYALILELGGIGIPIAAVAYLIFFPDQALRLQAAILKAIHFCFRSFKAQYLASAVTSNVSTFFRNNVSRYVPATYDFRLKINWVDSPSDPVLESDGTLILRMRETHDQTRNILSATQLLLPQVVCPDIRPMVTNELIEALDLALLRKMSKVLGDAAFMTFRKHFLEPQLKDNNFSKEDFGRLVQLDRFGIFVPIFVQELNKLGIRLSDSEDLIDRTESIQELLTFLITIATREEHAHVPLELKNEDFRVAVLLMAASFKAETEGVTPYINRLNRNFALGAEAVYIVAFPKSQRLTRNLVKLLGSEMRYICSPMMKTDSRNTLEDRGHIYIAEVIRNKNISGEHFSQRIEELKLEVGSLVKGTVMDVSQDLALVDIDGLTASISCNETDWIPRNSCKDILEADATHTFVVTHIDTDYSELRLSLRLSESDPWTIADIPKVGDIAEVTFINYLENELVGKNTDNLEVRIPKYEASWQSAIEFDPEPFINTTEKALITDVDPEARRVVGSIIQLTVDPWDDIVAQYPKGTKLTVSVNKIAGGQVLVDLGTKARGYIQDKSFKDAGHEYENYRENLVRGQGLDAIVTSINKKKRTIILDLARNIEK